MDQSNVTIITRNGFAGNGIVLDLESSRNIHELVERPHEPTTILLPIDSGPRVCELSRPLSPIKQPDLITTKMESIQSGALAST